MTTPHEAPDWTPVERQVFAAHGWTLDKDTGTVVHRTVGGQVPLSTILDTLASELSPRQRPEPQTFSDPQRECLAQHGLVVGHDRVVRTKDGDVISRTLLNHLLGVHDSETNNPPPPGHARSQVDKVAAAADEDRQLRLLHRALGMQSTRTPWS